MKSGLMLGVNPNAEREENDYYATNPHALEVFLDKLDSDNIELNKNIWEPACGEGHLSKLLEDKGYNVKSTDLINRGYGKGGINFIEQGKSLLGEKEEWGGDILTNPPFKLAEDFVRVGMDILSPGNKLLLFLKIQFLESQKRKKLFKNYPLKYVYCYSERQQCAKNADFEKYTATTQFYAWYIWERGFDGETILRWI